MYREFTVIVRIPFFGTETFHEVASKPEYAESQAKRKARHLFGIDCEIVAVVPI